MRRIRRRNGHAYPRRLASAVLIVLLGGGLAIAAPAVAQTPGACDQYLPNCDRGDGPQGHNGNQQSPGSSESAGGPGGSTVSPAQAGGAAEAGSQATGGDTRGGPGSGKGNRGGVDNRLAGLSAGANAGGGDATGGDLLGTDFPVTGWIAVGAAVLAALAALLVARHGWGAWRRRGGATAG